METNNHSVFSLNYHLVMVTKYRRKVITDQISDRLKEIFTYIQPDYNITLKEWNHDKDHVHILFSAHPKSELTKFLNAYKSASSRLIKKEYPGIRSKPWKEAFWSQSFCLISAGGVTLDVLKAYIETQGERER
ncbi:MAG: IS200/IS605 family transposase [Clostridia bacterium]|nr:IS200/IS605 family transposase [Clostridia bacterium]